MSGITNVALSVFVFEIAALIGAAVMWSYWMDWRKTALAGGHPNQTCDRALKWPGFKVPFTNLTIPPQLLVAVLVFLIGNAWIAWFTSLADQRQAASLNEPRLVIMDTATASSGGTYETTKAVRIVSPFTPGRLILRARGRGIESMRIVSTGGWSGFMGPAKKEDGLITDMLLSPSGTFNIVIKSTSAQVLLEHEFQSHPAAQHRSPHHPD